MRKIGLIGGMSWAATESYYRLINQDVQKRAGGMCSGPMVIESLNFCDISRLTTDEEWDFAAKRLSETAQALEKAGATAILICANSMHRVYDKVQKSVDVPILHIADCIAEAMKAKGVERAALIGTRNVMVESFFRQRLVRHGIRLLPPNLDRANEIDDIIYNELMHGIKREQSIRDMKTYLTNVAKEDIDGVILGATELSMIVNTEANVVDIYDFTEIHAKAAANWILQDMMAEA